METPWITETGSLREEELVSYLEKNTWEYSFFVAFLTDGMRSGKSSQIDAVLLDIPYLLELRLFDRNHEFWLYRSMIGQEFFWRIADDRTLETRLRESDQVGFFAESANYRLKHLQKLDIASYPEEQPYLSGNRCLRTTGGGLYELPVTTEDAVLLVSYIGYDDRNGCAKVVDFRMKEFTDMFPQKGEN